MFVAVAETVSDDADLRAVRIHFGSEAADPDMTISAPFAGDGKRISDGVFTAIVLAAYKKFMAVIALKLSTAVTLIEVPLAVWATHYGMKTVVMILSIESGEPILALVDLWVKLEITVDISIDNQVRGLGHNDFVAKDTDAKRSDQFGVLHKDMRAISLTILISVL